MRRKKQKNRFEKGQAKRLVVLVLFFGVGMLTIGGLGVYHRVAANAEPVPIADLDPNIGLRTMAEEFFKANGAADMLPIISCESGFRHFSPDGSVLRNKEGSSAIGIAQILASKHPDPKLIRKYNRLYNTDLSIDDFDITTVEGNLAYALLLYELNDTRDWECAKRFRFQS